MDAKIIKMIDKMKQDPEGLKQAFDNMYAALPIIELIKRDAKKEVFDDIECSLIEIGHLKKFKLVKAFNYELYKKLKQRHLSTFADGKSDIINAK